jgi:hypothetical protein
LYRVQGREGKSEDGDRMFLQSIGIYLRVHIVSQPRITTLLSSLP